jgi:plastocyanin
MTPTRILRRTVVVLAVGAALVAVPAVPAGAGGGGCHDPAPTEGTGTTVEMGKFCMSPSTLRVEPGTTVTWRNVDPVLHNLFGLGWAYGDVAPGASVSHTFSDAGTFAYACTIHPGMVGTVVVGDGATELAAAQPVAAVTPDGPGDGDSSGAGAPLVVGLLGVALAAAAFFAGTRVRSRTTA